MMKEPQGNYAKISDLVDSWLTLHAGEKFDLDLICRQLQIHERANRIDVAKKLSYEASRGVLEKTDRIYRFIDATFKPIDWVNASEGAALDLVWPYGHEDGSQFGFDGRITISPGDIVVIAGVSNMGKTAFCLNFLWENMDKYPCTLMGNEYTPAKFKRRVSRMAWQNPLKEDGTPKFELIERRDSWKDIIRPDNINIIDWISMSGKGEFYAIAGVIEGIQSKLHDGVALLSIQKNENKMLGEGGPFSEQLSSLYLVIDYNRLTVRKAKEWHDYNSNGKVYGFEIIEGGTQFHRIRPVKKCPKCWGRGEVKTGTCENCFGTGWIDV